MALYLGGDKVKINLGGTTCRLNLFTATPIINSTWLMSSDNYILLDSNGIYLIPKDYSDVVIRGNQLLSFDGHILKDSAGLYLVYKEDE